jgi:hypothetical protein
MTRARSLSPEESDRVCDAVQKLMERYGTQAAVAKELTMPDGSAVSQASVSLALRRAHMGVTFGRAVAIKLGVPFEELVSGQMAAPDGARRYRDLPGWDRAAATVTAEELLPAFVVQIIGDAFVPFATRPIEPSMIVDLGMYWIKYAPLDVRKAAEKAAILAEGERRHAEEEARYAAMEDSGSGSTRRESVAELPAPARAVRQAGR